MLKQSGMSLDQFNAAAQVILKAIENTLSDEWPLDLHSHKNAKSEYAITAMLDHQIENLVIDRTFVDENNILWIIDYKTSSFQLKIARIFLRKNKKIC